MVYVESIGFVWVSRSAEHRNRRRVRQRRRIAPGDNIVLSSQHGDTEHAYNAPQRARDELCGHPDFPNMSKRRYDYIQTLLAGIPTRSTQSVISAVISQLKPKLRQLHRGYVFLSRRGIGLAEDVCTGDDHRERIEVWWSEDEEYNTSRLPKRPSSSNGGPIRPRTFKYRYPLRDYRNSFFKGLKYHLFGLVDPVEKMMTLVMDMTPERAESLQLPKEGRRIDTGEWQRYVERYTLYRTICTCS
ncbi:hypothetical protein PSACC_02121 [Paramicrosporidium saccamoebae]|uniref:Uncharacterized protein n=1 Tax=Paramicrosporidium saccamoebae TaxID=1246581 RepID=A0A2H9TJX3_9FUNG|nr:hypothetical protein PSACC_02121 [Paramicrosporidium saccamoebae]